MHGDQQEYKRELNSQFNLITAFSRETREKVYVQHRLEQSGDEVDDLLRQGASLYVCGDACHMAIEVCHTIATIISAQRSIPLEDAEVILKDMRATGKYQVSYKYQHGVFVTIRDY